MAFVFSRANRNYLTVPAPVVSSSTGLTICTWVKHSGVTQQRICGRSMASSTSNEVFALAIQNNNVRLSIGYFGMFLIFPVYRTDICEGGSVPPNVWCHVAGTYDGDNMRVFVNGKLAATEARNGVILNDTTTIAIGADYRSASSVAEFFDGQMEDLCIYNRALSSNEILNMFSTQGANRNHLGKTFSLDMAGGGPMGGTIPAGTAFKDMSGANLVATVAGAGMKQAEHYTRRRKALSGG